MKKLLIIISFLCFSYASAQNTNITIDTNLNLTAREAEQLARYQQQPKTGFGSQIRNYFLHPDQRVKDQRTGFHVGNFQSVLDGNLDGFLDAYLRWGAADTAPVSQRDSD